jgi:hypothetical protein
MVKHIVMWSLKEEVAEQDRAAITAGIKEHLEALVGVVPGLLSASVVTAPLGSSTHDLALVTELESPEALKGYATHPEHVKTANTYVRPYTCNRAALDYEI